MEVLARSGEHAPPFARAVRLRDGLVIALLAARGMRVGELASLTLGRNIFRAGTSGSWHIEFAPEERKAGGTLGYPVPAALHPFLDRYLGEARPLLLNGRRSDPMWISLRGRPMTVGSLQAIIHRRPIKAFGADAGRAGWIFGECR